MVFLVFVVAGQLQYLRVVVARRLDVDDFQPAAGEVRLVVVYPGDYDRVSLFERPGRIFEYAGIPAGSAKSSVVLVVVLAVHNHCSPHCLSN